MRVKSKDNEIDALRSQLTKSERERDNLLVEKSEVIRGLQERLDATQKRLAQSIAEVGSQGYNNVKAMHQVWSQKRFLFSAFIKNNVKRKFSKIWDEIKQNSPIHAEYPPTRSAKVLALVVKKGIETIPEIPDNQFWILVVFPSLS